MTFPFPQVKRIVYPMTFLRDVHFIFEFVKEELSDEEKTNLKDFFVNTFNLDANANYELIGNLSVYSKDIKFDFSSNRVELAIKQPTYRSYDSDSVNVWRNYMINFLKVLGIIELKKLSIYKYNELEYQSSEVLKVNSVMKDIFSSELLSDISKDNENLEELTRWEKKKLFKDESSNSLFTIEYGFRKKMSSQKNDALTLKTQIESLDKPVHINDLVAIMCSFNQILDNGFHWCVKPEVIEIMKRHE